MMVDTLHFSGRWRLKKPQRTPTAAPPGAGKGNSEKQTVFRAKTQAILHLHYIGKKMKKIAKKYGFFRRFLVYL